MNDREGDSVRDERSINTNAVMWTQTVGVSDKQFALLKHRALQVSRINSDLWHRHIRLRGLPSRGTLLYVHQVFSVEVRIGAEHRRAAEGPI